MPRFLRFFFFVNISLVILYAAVLLMFSRENFFVRADFTSFYTGWTIVRDGKGSRLYDLSLQAREQEKILQGRRFAQGNLPYINPPHATLPFVPLALFPRPAAFFLWTLLQLAFLVSFLFSLSGAAKECSIVERQSLITSLLAFPFLFTTLALGTFSLLLFLCLWKFAVNIKKGNDIQAGLWLVLGTVKPQFMIFPAMMLLGARRRRALMTVLLSLAFLVMISVFLFGVQCWKDYFILLRRIAEFQTPGTAPASLMVNFKGLLVFFLGVGHASLINFISFSAFTLAALFVLFLWHKSRKAHALHFELCMSATLLSGLLFSPHLYFHDTLLYMAPVVLFYLHLHQSASPRASVFLTFMSVMPLLFLITEYVIGRGDGIKLPVYVMLLLLMVVMAELWREIFEKNVANGRKNS